jgi:hypothetical protein
MGHRPAQLMTRLKLASILVLFLAWSLKGSAQEASDAIRYVSINLHFMLKADGSGNFNEYWDGLKDSTKNGYVFAEKIIEKANFELAHNQKMFRRPNGVDSIPVLPVNMQYVLKGVYFDHSDNFHNDDFFSGWDILDKFGVNPNTEINIFAIVPERTGSGIAIQVLQPEVQSAKLACKVSFYNKYMVAPDWSENYAASTINHEIGHLLGLYHTWNADDDCEDTPMGFRKESGEWGQCWGYQKKDPYCGNWLNVSNNIMDYNEHFPHAYTPCQINRIQVMLRSSALAFVEQIGGAAPLNVFMKVDKIYGPEKVIVEGTASFNDVSSAFELINLKKNPKMPAWLRKKVWKQDWTDKPLSRFNLADYMHFSKGNYYLLRTKVKSQEGLMMSTEHIFYVK